MQKLLLAFALLAGYANRAAAAEQVMGSVDDLSRGQPAVGDSVLLFRLDRQAQQEGLTTTDGEGKFTLALQHPNGRYLVRVVHHGLPYDYEGLSGHAMLLHVFDSSPSVSRIVGSVEILSAVTRGDLLHVSDMYEIRNESNPPLTLWGGRTFEVQLPASAGLDSVLAAGEGITGMVISATPVPGKAGHYAVSFPLRPGATKFAFNYDIPYRGRAAFRTWRLYPFQQFAVVIPSSMKFSSPSPAFQILATGESAHQVQAVNQIKAGEGPDFELSGTGPSPLLQQKSSTVAVPATLPDPVISNSNAVARMSLSRAGSRSGDRRSPLKALLALACAFLAACLCLKIRKARRVTADGRVVQRTDKSRASLALVEELKQELFQLETRKIRGSISRDAYFARRRVLQDKLTRLFS
jgi:hypothetical protein